MISNTPPSENFTEANALGARTANYLEAHKGVLSWIFSLDHKRIGVMYLVATLLFFLVGCVLGVVIRIDLLARNFSFLDAGAFSKFYTLHGLIMVFLFVIPAISASLGNFLLPLQIGARDLAFPRVNLAAFHLYLLGDFFIVYSVLAGPMDTSWSFNAPYSLVTTAGVIPAILGVIALCASNILTGLNFIVTLHKMRTAGMTWRRLPLFPWSLYVSSIVQVLAAPILAATLVILGFARIAGAGIYNPAAGGDPTLFQSFFRFAAHALVYVAALPAFGILCELVATHARNKLVGRRVVIISFLSIAGIGFLGYGQHLYVSGQSETSSAVFSMLGFAIVVPMAILLFAWWATIMGGIVVFTTPMLYVLAFLFQFVVGALSGLFLSALGTDIHLHGTAFVVAHFHYMMMGALFTAFLGGLHHWWPIMFGRIYNRKRSVIGFFLFVTGFNMTFFGQFILGARGMPRRIHLYADAFTELNRVSAVGAIVLSVGLTIILINLIKSIRRGEPASLNPWDASGLEWRILPDVVIERMKPDEIIFRSRP